MNLLPIFTLLTVFIGFVIAVAAAVVVWKPVE